MVVDVLCRCLGCGKEFLTPARMMRRGRGKYCTRGCAGRKALAGIRDVDRKGIHNGNWRGGVSQDNMRYKRRYVAKHPEAVKAHRIVYNAIRAGRLRRQPCVVCGSSKVEAHHDDYSKALDVLWLCRKHHTEARNNMIQRKELVA